MIVEYHRPNTLAEALSLLGRDEPITYPMGGGTVLNRGMDGDYSVVDLQALGLGTITHQGSQLEVGATVTLQTLLDFDGLPDDFYKVIEHEATTNLRQMATIAGKIITASGRSPLATALLALDASLEIHFPGKKAEAIKLGNWLPMRKESIPNGLITKISIPTNIQFAYEYVARTPADLAIVCAAVSHWNSGRTRLALGGWGITPILAMDGPNPDGIEIAGNNAYSEAGDQWASAEYRQEIAGILSRRCINKITVE